MMRRMGNSGKELSSEVRHDDCTLGCSLPLQRGPCDSLGAPHLANPASEGALEEHWIEMEADA